MANTKAERARTAAQSASNNEYVRRLIEDDQLRDSIRTAYDSARAAYGRVSGDKKPAKKLMDDKKVHRELREAAENLREASDRLRGREKKSSGIGKLLVIAVAGAALALVLSEDLRKTVLDKLFGAEEEFEYTSTTVPGANVNGN
jgi:hypothetical protein